MKRQAIILRNRTLTPCRCQSCRPSPQRLALTGLAAVAIVLAGLAFAATVCWLVTAR
jgi:hypothetical protein